LYYMGCSNQIIQLHQYRTVTLIKEVDRIAHVISDSVARTLAIAMVKSCRAPHMAEHERVDCGNVGE